MSRVLIDPNQWEGTVRHANARGRYLLDDLADNIKTWQALLKTGSLGLYDKHQVPLAQSFEVIGGATALLYRMPLERHGEVVATLISPYTRERIASLGPVEHLVLQLALVLADLTEWAETEAERRGEKLRLVEEYGMTPEVRKLLALCGLQEDIVQVMVTFELGTKTPFQHMEILRRFIIAEVWRYREVFPWIAYRPDGVMTLCPNTRTGEMFPQVQAWIRAWTKSHPDLPIRVYIQEVAQLGDLPAALHVAETMMQFSARFGIFGMVNPVVDKHYVKILAGITPEDLAQLVHTVLGPLLRPENYMILCTLEAYLGQGQSLAKTGKALYVHPNTALYRIRQAEKLIGMDLKNTEQLTTVWIALRGHSLLSIRHGYET